MILLAIGIKHSHYIQIMFNLFSSLANETNDENGNKYKKYIQNFCNVYKEVL